MKNRTSDNKVPTFRTVESSHIQKYFINTNTKETRKWDICGCERPVVNFKHLKIRLILTPCICTFKQILRITFVGETGIRA
jgi:hypothetical protein